MRFYLGTHEPTWLNRAHVPLFVSAVRLRARCKRKLPRAAAPWALDSGGFSVLDSLGHYPTTNREYAAEVRRWSDEIGQLDWAACQDWMTEERILGKTGLTVAEHQARTVQSYDELRQMNTGLPFLPVLQGFELDDYLRCADLYAAAGYEFRGTGMLVGVGSICRRQGTAEAERIIRRLHADGFELHGFGFKLDGLLRCRSALASADSLAWSDGARKDGGRERVRLRKLAASPSLFDRGEPEALPDQNGAGTALAWLHEVRTAAGITEEAGQTVCPHCGSLDVHPPLGSLTYGCVECGESWGDITAPSLTDATTPRRPR
jgi:hypothetical protein